MNGILNIMKPPGMTSFDVVAYLRGILKTRKIGHTGTLDPDAVGVLPVCIGNATGVIDYITEKNKSYRAEITLGIETETQDASGRTIAIRDVRVTDEQFIKTLKGFEGAIQQLPPMYSAVKVDGKRLYELARMGKTVERKPRTVMIFSLKYQGKTGDFKYLFDIECSKGTYIRTLCADIGEKLGCGAHMSFLARTATGPFTLDSAFSPDEIFELAETERIGEALISVDSVFSDKKGFRLDKENEKKFRNGVAIVIQEKASTEEEFKSEAGQNFKSQAVQNFKTGELVRVYAEDDSFVALAEIRKTNTKILLKSKKFFN